MFRCTLPVLVLSVSGLAQSSPPGACPLNAAQIGPALGVAVLEAKPGLRLDMGGSTLQDCRYKLKLDRREFTLMLKTTTYNRSVDPQQHYQALAGRLTPVPNDPDQARLQEGQGDLTSPAVHYFRRGVGVELRLLGTYYQDLKPTESEFSAWGRKLLALPRIP
jgi:hypothetical protein